MLCNEVSATRLCFRRPDTVDCFVQLAGMVVCSLLVGFVVVFKRWLVVISDVSLLISLIFP